MTKAQQNLLEEIRKHKKITCLHILDQSLTDDLVAIILSYEEHMQKVVKIMEFLKSEKTHH